MKKWTVAFGALALVLAIGGRPCVAQTAPAAGDAPAAEPEKPKIAKVGDAFPLLELPIALSGGKTAKLDAGFFRQVTGIVFMNTSCLACRSELELLNAAKQKYQDKLNVVAISIDMNGEKAVEMYTTKFKFDATYLLDPEFTVPPKLGVSYTPALVIVGKDGKIKAVKTGYNPSTDRDAVVSLLKDAM